jgi:hypothetical protein
VFLDPLKVGDLTMSIVLNPCVSSTMAQRGARNGHRLLHRREVCFECGVHSDSVYQVQVIRHARSEHERLLAKSLRLVIYLASGIDVIGPGQCAQKEGHRSTINRQTEYTRSIGQRVQDSHRNPHRCICEDSR